VAVAGGCLPIGLGLPIPYTHKEGSNLRFPFEVVYQATMKLLPASMDSPRAKALLIAIGLQESRFLYRRQLGLGPAKGFWQFEQGGGIKGVLTHPVTRPHIEAVLKDLGYQPDFKACWDAVEHNDILACAFARLNLWWIPGAIPGPGEFEKSWNYYIFGWRPGKPHRSTWDEFYRQAWATVGAS
jgi:hypothetical protein